MQTIAVLLTCHNRVAKTLECLSHLFNQSIYGDMNLKVYLVDDGSTDGTGTIVKEKYPKINVIYGNGDLFWNRGMHRAFGEALKVGFDFYLWLNDDTLLYPNALSTLLEAHLDLVGRGRTASIIVASTRDSVTGEFTYGGLITAGKLFNPLQLRLQPPRTEAVSCDTMCGNCVLIPKQVTDVIGNIDPTYLHRYGDVDYGLRARAAHCDLWIAPGYLADCQENPNADRHQDQKLSFRERLDELHGLKGLGKGDWFRFVRTHGGPLWIGVWVLPYLRLIYDSFRKVL